jgi:hypothetical protein
MWKADRMRRVVRAGALTTVVLLAGLIAVPAAPALAAAKPVTMCTVGNKRLDELSGLAVTRTGYVTVNDGSDDPQRRRIFYLTSHCGVSRSVGYPSRPRDTEDLALAPDGTLWVADIGDNDLNRETVGLWQLAPGAAEPVLHRFTYPDGAHDAESLLLNGDGTPIIVTKDPFIAGLYVPAAEPRAGVTTALRKAGTFRIPVTETSNPFGIPGRLVLTGGATAPDGSKVALRTYADAFEFPVTGGDVIAAVTTGTPVTTALPDEPQGESVAYTADGSSLLTVSESSGSPAGDKPRILRYPSAVHAAAKPLATPGSSAAASSAAASSAGQDADGSTSAGVALALGIGVLVLALLTVGLIRLHRRG